MEQAIGRIEERYSSAACTSNIDSDNILSGAAHLLVASGLAAAQGSTHVDGRPTASLGHALARLQSEWQSIAKPIRQQPQTVKQWIELLPLVQVAGHMTRDKAGAKVAHDAQRIRLDDFYARELQMLAQKLPSRFAVRLQLFGIARLWAWEDPEEKVAAVIQHWLDDACPQCHGTGEVMRGERVVHCPKCRGEGKSRVPCGDEGYRLHEFMLNSKARWIAGVKNISRRLHQGVDMEPA